MWDILRNAQVVVALLASCLSILGTVLALRGRRRRAGRSGGLNGQHLGQGSQSPAAFAGWPGTLDFWDWAEAAGKGLLVGGRKGLVASCCAAPGLAILLFLLFAFVIPTVVNTASAYFILLCGGAAVIGVAVGTVSGVNEARRQAGYKRVFKSIFRQY